MTLHVTEKISEGDLTIQLVTLVKGNEGIHGAENVSVRVHSECLTGDVLYSKKCDCGDQKLKFMHLMEAEQHAVFLYIKGHEGRGAGLHNKVIAYSRRESGASKTHIDALLDIGCQSDVREYTAAFRFLRERLKIKSVKLYSNNPDKIDAALKIFGASYVIPCPMPAGKLI